MGHFNASCANYQGRNQSDNDNSVPIKAATNKKWVNKNPYSPIFYDGLFNSLSITHIYTATIALQTMQQPQ